MIRSITHTLGTKVLTVLLQLALLFITTKLMGAEIKGQIGLLVLNLTLISLIAGVIGGPALVFLTPRYRIRNLLLIGYAWSLVVAPSGAGLLAWSGSAGFPGFGSFLLLALAEAILAVHAPILLGARRVAAHNYSLFMKPLVTVAILAVLQWHRGNLGFNDFLWAYFAGLIAALIFSAIKLARLPVQDVPSISWSQTLRASLRYGFPVQMGNVAQLLNYRLSLYLLEIFTAPGLALARIGIYSAVLQVSESLLQFARSVAVVQYSEVSNIDDKEAGLQLIKLNYVVTSVGSLMLLLLPNKAYIAFLGGDFFEIKAHLYFLVPGMVALSVSSGISHYFSGVGLHRLNTVASAVGLIFTAVVGIPAIAFFGSYGAAATASVVYIAVAVFQFFQLKRRNHISVQDLRITSADITGFRHLLGRFLRSGQEN